MSAATDSNGKSTWGLITSVVVAVVVVCGAVGGMALTPLSIKADANSKSIDSVKQDIESLRAELRGHAQLPAHPVMDARLVGEVHRLDERISGLATALAEDIKETTDLAASFQAEKARMESQLVEIETQFSASSQFQSIQFSDQQRINSIMWEHIPELGKYPPGPFFQPNISNRENKK